MKGKFIVIYGINNIGKSTQIKKILDWFKTNNIPVEYLKYPIYDSPTGEKISDILRSGTPQEMSEEDFQTLYYQNRVEFEPELKKKLEAGINIIAECYIGTGVAWGTVKGADYDKLVQQNSDLLKEDLAILMDGERFKEAIEENHIHEQNDGWMKQARDVFLRQSEEFNWKTVNANQDIEKVFKDILVYIEEVM